MSDTVSISGRPGRPATVTVAASLVGLLALLTALSAFSALAALAGTVDRFRTAAAAAGIGQGTTDNLVTTVRATQISVAVLLGAGAMVLLGLAYGVWIGSQVARILTWLGCLAGLCLGCCGTGTSFGLATSTINVTSGNDETQRAGELLLDAYPDWFSGLGLGIGLLQLLGFVVVAVVLAVPPAHRYFSRRP